VRSSPGLTLVEVVVALALLAVATTSLVAAFGVLQRSAQRSKAETIASGLARELMETLKSQRYALLRPTTPADVASPGHDATYFPPDTTLAAGCRFARFNRVTKVYVDASGRALPLPPGGPDAGLKRVEVWVEWTQEGAPRRLAASSLLGDPDRAPASGTISGKAFRQPGGAGLELTGVEIVVEQDAARRDVTAASGAYAISVASGAFSLRAQKHGYFPARAAVAAVPDAAQDFVLVSRASGVVEGAAYLRDHPVISRVVLSTTGADGFEAQYVELYNPTTAAVLVPGLRLRYRSTAAPHDCADVPLAVSTAAVAPSGYYVIANTAAFVSGGLWTAADAHFADAAGGSCLSPPPSWAPPAQRRLLQAGQAGALELRDASGRLLDAVGWTAGADTPPGCEGACVGAGAGPGPADQLLRLSAPGAAPGAAPPSFDSDSNAVDWALAPAPGPALPPRVSGYALETPPTGTPAVGALISADDGLSSPVVVVSTSGRFELPGVATCTEAGLPATWTVQASSRGLAASAAVAAPAGGTTVDAGALALTTAAVHGIVRGQVRSSTGAALPGVLVACAGSSALTDAAGEYRLTAPAGTGLVVSANAGHADPARAAAASAPFDLAAGQTMPGVDFVLGAVGRVSGFVTIDGVNALPGALVEADAPPGTLRATTTTDAAGAFVLEDVPASDTVGAYSVFPVLDAGQSASPTAQAATVTPGAEVAVGTFTVSRALATIAGTVSDGGAPIGAGVLVVAALVALGSDPPVWDEALRGGATYYYAAHARADGTFALPVRVSGTPYNVYAWYSRPASQTATETTRKEATRLVNLPGTFTVSFSWP
jgi:type II secretory pathway pseudopilin PulG